MRIAWIIAVTLIIMLFVSACDSTISQPSAIQRQQASSSTPITTPGKSHFNDVRVLYANSVDLKAGETKLIDVTLETRKDGPGEFSGVFIRTDKEYGKDTLPMLSDLQVSIEPPKVIAYPNNTYNLTITIKRLLN